MISGLFKQEREKGYCKKSSLSIKSTPHPKAAVNSGAFFVVGTDIISYLQFKTDIAISKL
jgi:hypothetical protein